MKQAGTPKLLFRTTQRERIVARKGINLSDATITKRTQERYYNAVRKLLPRIEKVDDASRLDSAVTDWVEHEWRTGATLSSVSDGLCGLVHFEPYTKKLIPSAWRLFKAWRRVESPNRAPPLTKDLVYAMAYYCVLHNDLALGALLLLAFFALLRTGEVLAVCGNDLMFHRQSALVRLSDTKTGKRHCAGETVAFDDPFTIDILHELLLLRKDQVGLSVPLWLLSPQGFRYRFAHLLRRLGISNLGFRPYSLRRGGATWLFQETGSMETAMLKGRWGSPQVAKVYIMDGLSYVPQMKLSPGSRRILNKYHPFSSPF